MIKFRLDTISLVISVGILALMQTPASANQLRPIIPAAGSGVVVDSQGANVGLYFPDIPNNEYVLRSIGGVTFTAEVDAGGIRGGADSLYFESNCSGQPYLQADAGELNPDFHQPLTVPFSETFSRLSEHFAEGQSPLFYANSTTNFTNVTVCAVEQTNGQCLPIPGCESLLAYPAATWDWSRYVLPFGFK